MAQEKPPRLVKAQFILFGILLFIFLIWSASKCTRSTAPSRVAAAPVDSTLMATPVPPAPANDGVARDTIRGGQVQIVKEKVSPLYVTIGNLAVRTGPGLKYEIIDRLKLYDEVNFMHQVTDSLYTVKLGSNLTTTKPWVKIKTRKGREGWVYGAGVDFYKYKLEGVD